MSLDFRFPRSLSLNDYRDFRRLRNSAPKIENHYFKIFYSPERDISRLGILTLKKKSAIRSNAIACSAGRAKVFA